jgi:hypothetical protein
MCPGSCVRYLVTARCDVSAIEGGVYMEHRVIVPRSVTAGCGVAWLQVLTCLLGDGHFILPVLLPFLLAFIQVS